MSDIDNAVRAHPECDAIATANGVISYRRFGEQVSDFIAQLESSTAPGEFIGIEATRTPGSIVAMVGALKAGRPFLFIDPRDSASYSVKINMLGIATLARTPARSDAPVLGEVPAQWRGAAEDRIRPPWKQPFAASDRIGYAIYTSGSTGEPKCVLVRVDPLGRVIRDHAERLALDTTSRTLQFARLTFDGCITEILWTLTSGACLVVLDEEHLGPGPALQNTLERFHVTHVKTTPFALTATAPTRAMSLRHVINGGGACRQAVVRKWSSVAAFHNAYGTTETTICNFLSGALDPDDCADSVPLGELVGEGGYQLAPLPEAAEATPIGSAGTRGELVMTGDCVALGYLAPHGTRLFVGDDGDRVYRTGDIVELRGGQIFYVERLDRQMKVRGYRLDPGEIESAACRLSGVEEAVVTAESHEDADTSDADALVCYYLGAATPRDVRAHLERVLDSYKVPSVILQIERMPYTRNGKVDRSALRASRRRGAPAGRDDSPADRVLGAVRRLTGTADVSLDDNFFEVGGDSASTVQLVGTLKQLGWMDVGVRDVLRAENLKALVAQLPDQGV
ncbi:non-ribosomal peptide synthetase [Micromonospora olivasterospora]|uniref:non-ribosomal peptide synthetase n=1 Tax=Micromonospora olivasterospora TaxID=1880 RepID=UPI001B85C150|nr:non-ribosomal peptide synthetase [Micromonospora olivasterospora]